MKGFTGNSSPMLSIFTDPPMGTSYEQRCEKTGLCFPASFDTNRGVESQKATMLKFWISVGVIVLSLRWKQRH